MVFSVLVSEALMENSNEKEYDWYEISSLNFKQTAVIDMRFTNA